MSELEKSVIFPKGEPVYEHFTGTAYLEVLTKPDEVSSVLTGNVTFEPCTRNDWHVHELYQILLVTGGRGYYQEEGKPARRLEAGDVVKIPGGVKHWHGAARDEWFVHLVVIEGRTEWHEPVSDTDYEKVNSRDYHIP